MGHVISTTFFDSLLLRIKEHSIKKDTHTMVIHAQITRHTIVCMSFHLHWNNIGPYNIKKENVISTHSPFSLFCFTLIPERIALPVLQSNLHRQGDFYNKRPHLMYKNQVSLFFCIGFHYLCNTDTIENTSMKRNVIIWVGFLIALAVTAIYAVHLWNIKCKRIASWNMVATEAFKYATNKEISDKSLDYRVSISEASNSYRVYLPDSIKEPITPKQKYIVSKTKLKKNYNSTCIITKPFSAERIRHLWDSLLNIRHIPVNLQVFCSFTDIHNNTFVNRMPDEEHIEHALDTIYAGCRCEAEVIGYVDYPAWWSGIGFLNWLLLLFPWGCFGCFVVNYDRLLTFYLQTVQKEVVIEKTIHLADVQIEKAQIYRLPDGVFFDTYTGTLIKDERNCSISPQSSNLLKLFLRNADKRLSAEEINGYLWGGKGTKEQLQNSISRLRKTLKVVGSSLTVQNIGGYFELKTPISSKNMDLDING